MVLLLIRASKVSGSVQFGNHPVFHILHVRDIKSGACGATIIRFFGYTKEPP